MDLFIYLFIFEKAPTMAKNCCLLGFETQPLFHRWLRTACVFTHRVQCAYYLLFTTVVLQDFILVVCCVSARPGTNDKIQII